MSEPQTTELNLIELDRLERSPLNARRTETKEGFADLKASILAHGLMQNLVVTANGGGKFYVIAGGRRLEALRALQEEGKLPDGYAVPCQVVADEQAVELSLAENTIRVAMHPADEFEAFAALVDRGLTTSEVADRFGVTEKHVCQRLRLARVAPELIAEYREEKIDLECLMAFTVTDDRAKQLSVYRSAHDWQRKSPHHIRRCLTEKMVEADSKLAGFVGLDAYEAAGGTTRTDLFGDTTYFEDPELLAKLVAEKLDDMRQRLLAEGWGWVEVSEDRDYSFVAKHGRLKATPTEESEMLMAERKRLRDAMDALQDEESPEGEEAADDWQQRYEELEAQLDAVNERIDACVAFDPKKIKSAGCYVFISHDGKLVVERGLVRKKDAKQLEKAKKGKRAEAATEPGEQLSDALRNDLKAFRLQAAQVELARHPEIAFDLLVFYLASDVLEVDRASYDGPAIGVSFSCMGDDSTFAAKAFVGIAERLPQEWLKSKHEVGSFEEFRQLSRDDKLSLLAYCTATALRPKLTPSDPDDVSAYDVALALTTGNVAEYWRPTKENYFSRITHEQLVAIGTEVLGEEWMVFRKKYKKGKLADELHEAFATPDARGRTPGQVEKLKTWLPAGMAFGLPVDEKPAKGKKGKKAT